MYRLQHQQQILSMQHEGKKSSMIIGKSDGPGDSILCCQKVPFLPNIKVLQQLGAQETV